MLAPLSPKQIALDQEKKNEKGKKAKSDREHKSENKNKKGSNSLCKKKMVERALNVGRTIYLLLLKADKPSDINQGHLLRVVSQGDAYGTTSFERD